MKVFESAFGTVADFVRDITLPALYQRNPRADASGDECDERPSAKPN